MQKNNKYTAADFERYHSGRMSEAEMHAIEKAALEDPFLADALEGYSYTTSPVKDIGELKEKLFARKKKKNIFLAIQKQNVWLRIAALFILIAGIGYLAYQLNLNKGNNELAKNENRQELKNETRQNIIPKSDSINDQKETTVSPLTAYETVITKDNKKTNQGIKLSRNKAIENKSNDQQLQSVQTIPNPEVQRDLFKSSEKNLMEGLVVDSFGNPIRYATIKDKNAKINTVSDSTGRFILKTNDSSMTADISALGYKTKEKILSDKKEQVIVMEQNSHDLQEVVVTGYGVKRQKRDLGNSSQLEGKVSGIAVNDSSMLPVVGWQKFNEYVKKNINIPMDDEGKNYKGSVVLSFEINKKGNPKNINVEQSLCSSCDKEATRLLKNGPKWIKINGKRNSVTIRF